MRLYTKFSIGAFALITSAANAQFTATNAGPINSFGHLGNPLNGQFSQTYSGPSTVFTSLQFDATLTSIAGDTWESDSLWSITGPGGSGYEFQPSGDGLYAAPQVVSASISGLFWFQGGSTVNFGAFQHAGVPDGTRASWSNISFNWSGSISNVADLGSFNDTSSLTFDTLGTTGVSDTHIALYTTSGVKVAESDDISDTNWMSSMTVNGLAQDKYLLIIGSAVSTFGDGFALPGDNALSYGQYNLNVNNSSFGTGTLAAGEFKTYSFEVVPEPGTMAVVGLGVAALIRRRRK